MKSDSRIALSLLLIRLSVTLVIFMWTIDKFLRPDRAAAIFEKFYFIGGLGALPIYILAAVEMVILIGFVAGFKKRWTYGAILFFHTVSTVSAWKQYFNPFQDPNLLFFAAWPMLAACFTLYLLRDFDTMFAVDA
ncbi:MAG: hypothetical protein AAFN18_16935 [Cyanobacteria bacterium J06554_6]